MSIHANFDDGIHKFEDVIVKVDRIWGSIVDGWAAWINVVNKSNGMILKAFRINTLYIENQNPFILLYDALSKCEYLSNIWHDVDKLEVVSNVSGNTSVITVDSTPEIIVKCESEVIAEIIPAVSSVTTKKSRKKK